MVFVLKRNVPQEKIDQFIQKIEADGFSTIHSTGTEHTVV